MTSYNVQITSDDPTKPKITLRLDIDNGSTVLRELNLTTDGTAPLAAGELPVLDLNQIVAAVTAALQPAPTSQTAATSAPASQPAEASAPAADTPRQPGDSSKATRRRTVSTGGATAQTQPTLASGRQAKIADTAAGIPASEVAAPPKKKAVAAKKAGTRHAAPGAASGRTYRRLPDDFTEVLRQTGDSAAAIADYYQVPRHTAYSWIRTHGKQSTASAQS